MLRLLTMLTYVFVMILPSNSYAATTGTLSNQSILTTAATYCYNNDDIMCRLKISQVACDNNALTQCQDSCRDQWRLCTTGHDDGLPCDQNYNTCLSNCKDINNCN